MFFFSNNHKLIYFYASGKIYISNLKQDVADNKAWYNKPQTELRKKY